MSQNRRPLTGDNYDWTPSDSQRASNGRRGATGYKCLWCFGLSPVTGDNGLLWWPVRR